MGAGTFPRMFSRAIRVLSIRGIDVRLDPTLIVLAALIVWTFAVRFAAEHGWGSATVMALGGMVLFLASILAHELAHALEARHRGIQVEGITLLVFGGVTQMHAHSSRPRDEFVIAAVGPFVSLLAGSVLGLSSLGAGFLPAGEQLTQLLRLLAALNVALALFNLVPGAPLDGGRVLRAGLWALLGDRSRAIRWAARCGQVLGLALVGYGIWVALRVPQAMLAALWYLAIGGFLYWAAGSEHRNSRLDDLYTRTSVREVVALGREHPATSFPLEAPADGDLPSDEAPGLPQVELDADLHDLVEAFQGDHSRVVLTDGGTPVATVAERHVAHAVALLRRGRRPTDPTPLAITASPEPGPSSEAAAPRSDDGPDPTS